MEKGPSPEKRAHSFPWWGGKYRLAPTIVKYIPKHRVYCEVFGGAASVLLAKQPSPIEVYNDVDSRLVNLFEVIRNQPLEFLGCARDIFYSRKLFETWKRWIWREDDYINQERLSGNVVEVAVQTYYTIVSGFCGDPTKGWAFARSTQHGGSARWTSVADKIGPLSERFRHVNIDCLGYEDSLKNWDSPETFFYCDPPYFHLRAVGQYKFAPLDHVRLCNALKQLKGKWLLSYDDVRPVRRLYKGYNIVRVSSPLSCEKISAGEKRAEYKQILIANYPLRPSK